MAAPYSNLRSKLNRAICAYLVSVGAGKVDDTFPATSQAAKLYPNTTVKATRGIPEVPLSGIYRIQTFHSVKGSATQDPGEPNPQLARVQFDNRVALTYDALMQSDDGDTLKLTARLITAAGRALVNVIDTNDPVSVQFAADNADMADFTVTDWYDQGFGDGQADAEGCAWEEILIFDAVCVSSNVD